YTWPFLALFRFRDRFDGAQRQHADQMRAVCRAAMNVRDHVAGVDLDAFDRLAGDFFRERALHRGHAEDAALARAGDGDPHAFGILRDEHADQRVARCRIWELQVSGPDRYREAHARDDLALTERRFEQAGEEIVRADLAPVGDDGRIEREARRRIIRRRIVVRDRAADRAAVAHRRIADSV